MKKEYDFSNKFLYKKSKKINLNKNKIDTIEYEEKITKLKKLKEYQDLDFLEVGIDDEYINYKKSL